VEPKALFTKIPVVPGSDGKKMSKSYGNTLMLNESAEETDAKLKRYFTDPEKLRKGDPGHPDICPVYMLHKIYTPDHEKEVAPPCKGRLQEKTGQKSEWGAGTDQKKKTCY